jgi:hypothetical protein
LFIIRRENAQLSSRRSKFVETATNLFWFLKFIEVSGKMFKTISLTVLLCGALLCEASNEVQSKFREDEIVPDVLEDVPELETLKISYPSGVSVNMGNVLTPTQVKDQPKVEFEAEAGAFYTLLMTGWLHDKKETGLGLTFISPPQIPMHLRERIQSAESSDIGCW